MRLKFQVERSPHLEAFVCFRCTAPWSAQKRAKEKLNLFQFPSTTMAQARARAVKIVGCKIAYASLPGAALHRVPNYVGCHARFLSQLPAYRTVFSDDPIRANSRVHFSKMEGSFSCRQVVGSDEGKKYPVTRFER